MRRRRGRWGEKEEEDDDEEEEGKERGMDRRKEKRKENKGREGIKREVMRWVRKGRKLTKYGGEAT